MLVQANLHSELVLRLSSFINHTLTYQAHICARGTKVDDLRLKAVDKQPGAIALIRRFVQTPTSLIRNGLFVKSF